MNEIWNEIVQELGRHDQDGGRDLLPSAMLEAYLQNKTDEALKGIDFSHRIDSVDAMMRFFK